VVAVLQVLAWRDISDSPLKLPLPAAAAAIQGSMVKLVNPVKLLTPLLLLLEPLLLLLAALEPETEPAACAAAAAAAAALAFAAAAAFALVLLPHLGGGLALSGTVGTSIVPSASADMQHIMGSELISIVAR
jgi:hypothetical protein